MTNDQSDLAIFTCVGREHLLSSTVRSFERACSYKFNQRIISVDGCLATQCLSSFRLDKLVQNIHRVGYVQSIINALNIIDSEFFFWLEDDWNFLKDINLEPLIELLSKNPDWVQIRLSKTGSLTQEERNVELSRGVFSSIYGFSANPSLCRTELVKAGFKAIQEAPKGEKVGFENFLSNWFENNGLMCAVLDLGDAPIIEHLGYLESTPRQWHMTESLEGKTAEYLSGTREAFLPPLWRRSYMVLKLMKIFARVATRQFWSREAYDLAFRITIAGKDC